MASSGEYTFCARVIEMNRIQVPWVQPFYDKEICRNSETGTRGQSGRRTVHVDSGVAGDSVTIYRQCSVDYTPWLLQWILQSPREASTLR